MCCKAENSNMTHAEMGWGWRRGQEGNPGCQGQGDPHASTANGAGASNPARKIGHPTRAGTRTPDAASTYEARRERQFSSSCCWYRERRALDPACHRFWYVAGPPHY